MTETDARGDDAAVVSAPRDAFAFGQNWQRYVSSYLTPDRERRARESLVELLETDLRGKSFIDVGCGSGIFSLGAHKLGAARIVSLDVDPDAVEACRALRRSAGDPASWEVRRESILDDSLGERLEPADVVYSWGVLHHTGDMRHAIANAVRLVKPGGLFCIAIYNRVTGTLMTSERWITVKRAYNRSPRPVQLLMEQVFHGQWVLRQLLRGRNPRRVAREYHGRGMAVKTDLVDWLGGYPYEFATPDEIVALCERELGLKARKVVAEPPRSLGNNEFVFERVHEACAA